MIQYRTIHEVYTTFIIIAKVKHVIYLIILVGMVRCRYDKSDWFKMVINVNKKSVVT